MLLGSAPTSHSFQILEVSNINLQGWASFFPSVYHIVDLRGCCANSDHSCSTTYRFSFLLHIPINTHLLYQVRKQSQHVLLKIRIYFFPKTVSYLKITHWMFDQVSSFLLSASYNSIRSSKRKALKLDFLGFRLGF